MRQRYPLLGAILADRLGKRSDEKNGQAWSDGIVADLNKGKGLMVGSHPKFRDRTTYGNRNDAAGGFIYWH
jgi:hypothetical protein